MTDEEKKPVEGAQADPKATEAAKAAPEPRDDDPGDEASPEGKTDSADKKPRKPWHEKRIGELTYNWRQAERDRDYWRELATRQPSQPQAQPAQQQTQATQKPLPAQYQSTEEYLEALADWKSEEKLSAWDRKRREEAERTEREQSTRKVFDSFSERQAKAREKFADFDEVAYSPDTPISPLMAEVITRAEMGPEIAYFLGKNPDKGLQISQMTDPHSVALALGRIEAQLAAPQPQPVTASAPKAAPTAAPPPPKTLSGSAPVQKNPEDMTTREWVTWRNAQIRKKRA